MFSLRARNLRIEMKPLCKRSAPPSPVQICSVHGGLKYKISAVNLENWTGEGPNVYRRLLFQSYDISWHDFRWVLGETYFWNRIWIFIYIVLYKKEIHIKWNSNVYYPCGPQKISCSFFTPYFRSPISQRWKYENTSWNIFCFLWWPRNWNWGVMITAGCILQGFIIDLKLGDTGQRTVIEAGW